MTQQALLIKPKDIPYIWHDVKPLLDKALKHANGELESSDVLKLLLEDDQHLFIGKINGEIQSALIGEFIYYPRKKAFRIITWSTKSGHDYKLWMPLFNIIENYAKEMGCDLIEAWTRKGLAKKLKWDNEYSIVTKHI